MNILPKKRWHVRTKDNIARVRRDEAQAAEEEKKKQQRIELAEREARTEALRKKAREQYGSYSDTPKPKSPKPDGEGEFSPNKHVNLFYELERDEIVNDKPNEEYEREKKLEREKYEKQIGYLTYLGQDTNELTGNVSWYNKSREEIGRATTEEVSKKQKVFEDPLVGIRKYLGCDGVKKVTEAAAVKVERVSVKAEEMSLRESRKRKKSEERSPKHRKHKKVKKSKKHKREKKKKKKSSSKRRRHSESTTTDDGSEDEVPTAPRTPSVDIEKLRAERLRRELQERQRAHEVFARINGVTIKKEEPTPNEPVQKYNSQFNPHLAKQNYM